MTECLVRHFLRRFIDNDLLSPDADSHEVLAIACATLASLGLFVTVFLSFKFFGYVPPGQTSLGALDDTALYTSASMILMALLAVVEWNGLALDLRDAAVLGPLPIPHGVVVRAKFAAITIFAAAFAAMIAVGPSLIHPLALAQNLHAGIGGLIRLCVADAAAIIGAGAFGFASVFALRETLFAVLGTAWFQRISTLVQGILGVALTTFLLLLPGAYSGVARSWLAEGRLKPADVPPLWFVGLHERLLGNLMVAAPRPIWLRAARAVAAEDQARALYRSRESLFPHLAHLAVAALGIVLLVAVAAYAWNTRRLPVPTGHRQARRRRQMWARIAQPLLARTPAAQAGFFFTIQSLFRSDAHRTVMTTAIAAALAGGMVSLHGLDVTQAPVQASIPISLLAVQAIGIVALVAGFRHATRIPSDVRASVIFRLALMRDEHAYLRGVEYAALWALIVPMLLFLLPGFILTIGVRLALAQLVCGACLAFLVMEGTFLRVRRIPFASSYVAPENLKLLGPFYVLALLAASYTLAWIVQLALHTPASAAAMAALSLIALIVMRRLARRRPPGALALEADEGAPSPTQRLDLGQR